MNAEPETADALIIASPQMLEKLPILNAAKLEFTTGISTAVDSSSELEKHEHILTGSRSLFPARGNAHLISATYQRCRAGSSHSKAANQDNLAAIADMLQLSSYNSFKVLGHYERERANTSDRMPLIGRYQDPMAKHDLTHPIFVSSAHGSTGLATCPFAAELVAADICGENLPVTEEQRLTLDPSRFDQRIQRKISSILAGVE
jgi:tRNA 5-methylaminomethyl-2-thiouridine biosynthesis bifunctional protein